ncbi:MAG: outer membrane beta-barrel protein [Bacteroidota bacterium]|nr:outer membrane beta-barrel protein [Bacteroidota bacterium]
MKRFFALLACSFLFFTVSAQDSKLILGVDVAATRSKLWGDGMSDAFNINPLYGFSPGINLEYILSPALSVKTGLCYERRGYWSDVLGPISDATTYNDYLLTPLVVSLSTKGVTKFYVNGGVLFGFLLSKTRLLTFYGDIDEEKSDASENARKYDFGLSFGCGVMRPIGSRILLDIGLRDNLGLIDTIKTENGGKTRYNTLGLVLSLKYRL